MKTSKFLLIIIVAYSIHGCIETPQPDVYEDVTGIVLYQSDPLPGADIYIRNYLKPGGYQDTSTISDDYTLEFNVPEKGIYSGSLFRYGADTAYAIFFNGQLSSGLNTLSIPGEQLSNGIIGYYIRNNLYQVTSDIIAVNHPDNQLLQSVPYTQTDSSGRFTLSSLHLAFGHTLNTDSTGQFSVSDTLQIIVADGQEIIRKKEVVVEKGESNHVEIAIF